MSRNPNPPTSHGNYSAQQTGVGEEALGSPKEIKKRRHCGLIQIKSLARQKVWDPGMGRNIKTIRLGWDPRMGGNIKTMGLSVCPQH